MESAGKSFLRGLWEMPQRAIGHVAGVARTGRLPRLQFDPEGREEYVYETPEGSIPVTSGNVMLLPPNTSEDTLAHERVHTEQSRRYGPLYELVNVLGGLTGRSDIEGMEHPLESEAYLRTEPQGTYRFGSAYRKRP